METQEFQKLVIDELRGIRKDIHDLDSRLSSRISDLDSRLSSRISDLDSRLSSRISDLDTRLNDRISEVEKSLAIFETRDAEKSKINAWLSKLFLIVIGGAIAILGRYLLP